MAKQEIKIVEQNVLIAERVPPGDKWSLLGEEKVHPSLTDTLEAYMRKTGFRGNYRLEPLNGNLYAIDAEEIEVEKPKEKVYSIYGEYGQ
jgi:hypothetical protein